MKLLRDNAKPRTAATTEYIITSFATASLFTGYYSFRLLPVSIDATRLIRRTLFQLAGKILDDRILSKDYMRSRRYSGSFFRDKIRRRFDDGWLKVIIESNGEYFDRTTCRVIL